MVITNTLFQQHRRWLYTWTSPDSQYWNQTDYIPCSRTWRSTIQSANTRPGADCGSDHQLLIAKFKLKLNKVEKTTGLQAWPKLNPLWLSSGSDESIQGTRSGKSKFGRLNSDHRTGKGQFLFQSQRKATSKNVQTTAQLCSFHTLAK